MPQLQDLLRTVAYASITVADSATRLTLGNVRGNSGQFAAEKVILTVETASIRWRDDGTDPTSTEGHLATVGTVLTLPNRNRIDAFRAIRTSATSATLRVSYLA